MGCAGRGLPPGGVLVIGGAGKMGGWFVDFFRSQGFVATVADAALEDGPNVYTNWTDAGVDFDVIVVAAPLAGESSSGIGGLRLGPGTPQAVASSAKRPAAS